MGPCATGVAKGFRPRGLAAYMRPASAPHSYDMVQLGPTHEALSNQVIQNKGCLFLLMSLHHIALLICKGVLALGLQIPTTRGFHASLATSIAPMAVPRRTCIATTAAFTTSSPSRSVSFLSQPPPYTRPSPHFRPLSPSPEPSLHHKLPPEAGSHTLLPRHVSALPRAITAAFRPPPWPAAPSPQS